MLLYWKNAWFLTPSLAPLQPNGHPFHIYCVLHYKIILYWSRCPGIQLVSSVEIQPVSTILIQLVSLIEIQLVSSIEIQLVSSIETHICVIP